MTTLIQTKAENETLCKLISRLIAIGDDARSDEDSTLLALLAAKVDQFERAAYPLPRIHPGEILTEEFLKPHGITPEKLTAEIGIPASDIDEIAKGKQPITAEIAVRLGAYFGTTSEFWINLQSDYDSRGREQP